MRPLQARIRPQLPLCGDTSLISAVYILHLLRSECLGHFSVLQWLLLKTTPAFCCFKPLFLSCSDPFVCFLSSCGSSCSENAIFLPLTCKLINLRCLFCANLLKQHMWCLLKSYFVTEQVPASVTALLLRLHAAFPWHATDYKFQSALCHRNLSPATWQADLSSLTHDALILSHNSLLPLRPCQIRVNKRLRPAARLWRRAPYIILSNAPNSAPCMRMEMETVKVMRRIWDVTQRQVEDPPFEAGGCIEAWAWIWTWGRRRWRCSPSGCGCRRNEPGVSPCVSCAGEKT